MDMKRITHRIIVSLLISLLCVIAIGNKVHADIGEKPSIVVTVENPPAEDYYVALLWGETVFRQLPEGISETYDSEEMTIEEFLESFNYHGLYWYQSPVGYNVFSSNIDHTYGFGYSVPRDFRVIIVLEDGSVRISDACSREEYNAEVTYDYSTGSLVEHREKKILSRILMILGCYVGTLVLEGFLLRFLGFPFNKRNVLSFLIINTLTNIPLNIYLSTISTSLGRAAGAFIPEIVICLVEGIFYYFTLEDKNGNRRLTRSFWYGVSANILSVILGAFIVMIFLYLYVAVLTMLR